MRWRRSSMEQETWPALAWAPPGQDPVTAGVPLLPEDLKSGLTRWTYRDRLERRVLAMVQSEPDPELAVDALAAELEARGLWPGVTPEGESVQTQVAPLLYLNPLWPDYRNLMVQLPEDEPFPVRRVPEVQRILRDTTLAEWMSRAFLPMDDLT